MSIRSSGRELTSPTAFPARHFQGPPCLSAWSNSVRTPARAPADPASGYNYRDEVIYGFSHTHLSGTGCADLFDILVMPSVGNFPSAKASFPSRFSHENESARPGFYQVKLLDFNVLAELTATEHVGFHRYTFPRGSHSHILVDLAHTANPGNAGHQVVAQVRVVDPQTLEGYRFTTGWVEGWRKVYFRAEFSKPFLKHTLLNGEEAFEGLAVINGKCIRARLDFATTEDEPVLIKVGLSSVSSDGARLNLSTELPGWGFDQVAKAAEHLWNQELAKVEVDATAEQKEIFYTALYHAFTQPNNIADVNGDYLGTDMTMRRAPDQKHYSTFSLWDTYRAANPL